MPNGMYGGGRGRKTKVGRKLLLFSSYSIVRYGFVAKSSVICHKLVRIPLLVWLLLMTDGW